MTTDDSMSDDVFESPEDMAMTDGERGSYGAKQMNVMSVPGQHTTPSPTGYRDYKPPAEVMKMYEQQQEEAEQAVHKVRQNLRVCQLVSWLSRNVPQNVALHRKSL
jgi:Ras-related protein Rab-37